MQPLRLPRPRLRPEEASALDEPQIDPPIRSDRQTGAQDEPASALAVALARELTAPASLDARTELTQAPRESSNATRPRRAEPRDASASATADRDVIRPRITERRRRHHPGWLYVLLPVATIAAIVLRC